MNLLNLYIKCIHLHVNKYMYTYIYECIYIPKNIHISDFITGIRKYNFKRILKEQDIFNTELQITKSHPDFEDENFAKHSQKTDCMHGRTLSSNGVYACPFLSNDYRGRVGSSFKNYSQNITAETDFCATCSKNNNFIFTIG